MLLLVSINSVTESPLSETNMSVILESPICDKSKVFNSCKFVELNIAVRFSIFKCVLPARQSDLIPTGKVNVSGWMVMMSQFDRLTCFGTLWRQLWVISRASDAMWWNVFPDKSSVCNLVITCKAKWRNWKLWHATNSCVNASKTRVVRRQQSLSKGNQI